MVLNNQIRLYETRTFLPNTNVTGVDEVPFYIVTGSRMLVTLQVTAIDPATTVTLDVQNKFNSELPYDTIETLSLATTGQVRRVLSDFYNLFNLKVTVAGGNASYKIGVALFDNSGTTRIDNAQLDVSLDHTLDALGHFDSVRIGDGTYILDINADGSINVNIVDPLDETVVNAYDEAPAVVPAVDTTIVSYTIPADKVGFLCRAEGSGENIGRYQVTVNDVAVATRRTMFGSDLTTEFNFMTSNKRSFELQEGDIIKLNVLHNRTMSGDYEARLQIILKDAP